MRKLILNIHLAIGIVAGVFAALLGVTGGILAFEPELDRISHRDISYVKPGGRALSLAEIGNAISQKYPGEGIVAYLPSTNPGFPTRVILSRGIVSINQYTGDVLGVRTRGQSFLGTVRVLHVRLAMGNPGPFILKWSSLATVVSLLSGLYLWGRSSECGLPDAGGAQDSGTTCTVRSVSTRCCLPLCSLEPGQ